MYWEKPAVFCPDRWEKKGAHYVQRGSCGAEVTLQQGSTTSLHEGASKEPYKRFLPFSEGPRSCVAQVLPPPFLSWSSYT